jgi:hypothetical protein
MSVYKATSWGRTRRPKHLVEHLPTTKQGATTVAVTAESDLNNNLNDGTEGQNGYSTENQRFLHVLVKTNNSKSVAIYAYNYAFGEWAQLFLPLGNATHTAAVATTGSGGEAIHYIFDIAGVDRVAFVSGDAPGTVRAACSTF